MRPGETVADRFQIEREAAEGGMGTVFRALDRTTGRPVALKELRTAGQSENARFAREAALLAELLHPGIVRYVAHGAAAGGSDRPWIAMEWLEGETLAERIARKPVTIAEGVRLIQRVAEALLVAHRKGVVHRDLKPSNLFLVERDLERPKILDFGVALQTRLVRRVTITGAAVGTPQYMAPEQARGETELTPRVDVYALGVVLFELIAGHAPFEGTSPVAVLAKILLDEPPRLRDLRPEVPEAIDELVATTLSKDPQHRPADAEALLAAIEEAGEMPAGGAPRRSAPHGAIGSHEQRLLCLVLTAGMDLTGASAPTLLAGDETIEQEARVREAVMSCGGTIEFLADGSTVAIVRSGGTPIDQAARAARCALSIRERLPDAPMALVAGRGMLAGRLPVGEVIDRGARVLEHAERQLALRDDGASAGALPIRLDDLTASLLDGRFDLDQDADGASLRGERRDVAAIRTLLGRASPFVGRDRELGSLRATVEESASEPVARAVLVTGPAGSGKSRLAHELTRGLDDQTPRTVLDARGDAMRAGSAFGLAAELVRSAAGIREGELLELRRQKLRARLGRHLDFDDLERVTVFLGELVRAPFPDDASEALRNARTDPMIMGDAIRAAFEDWLEAECGAAPVLVLLDDLQWGDLPSVTLLDGALRLLAHRPFALLAFARPEVHEHFPKLFAERELHEVRLAKLTRKASEKLVRDAFADKTVTDATVTQITERAEGNPFFLEELVRALARAPKQGAEPVLPPTLLAMVQARLDEIDPEGRRILRAASVFGRTFWQGGVRALLGGASATQTLPDRLEELLARELIVRHAGGAFSGEVELAFAQDAVREAAYSMLTDADRKLGHRLAGEWLEKVGETSPAVLAEHFDRGGARDRAASWWRAAAERALEGNDWAAADELAARGLACATDEASRGAFELLRADAFRWRGDYQRALVAATAALKVLPRGSPRWFDAVARACISAAQQTAFDLVAVWAEQARLAVPAPDAHAAQIICLTNAAGHFLGAGRYAEAHALIDLAVAQAGDLDDAPPLAAAWVRAIVASRALHAGDHGGYLTGTEAAAAAFDRAGDVRNACNQRVRLGYGLLELGEFAAAEEELRRAHASAERMRLPVVAAYAMQNIGAALAHQGRLEEAAAAEQLAIEYGVRLANARIQGSSRIYVAMIAQMRGDLEIAEREARHAVDQLQSAPPLQTAAQALLARILLARGDLPAARSAAETAMARLESMVGMEEGEALIRLVHAETLQAAGETATARDAIRAAKTRLESRAAKITDPRWRRSFLENVPDHARTLALATAWA